MSVNQVDQHFHTKFLTESYHDYQRMESQLRRCTTTTGSVDAGTVKFHRFDVAPEATTRGRDGRLAIQRTGRSNATATLKEHHYKDVIDNFDLFRSNVDERSAMSKIALGSVTRAEDAEIIRALSAATTVYNSGTAVELSTLSHVLANFRTLANNDVPVGDGNMYAIISPAAYYQMLRMDDFKSVDYVDVKPLKENAPIMKGVSWMGCTWLPFTGVPGNGTASATCFLFHKSSIGHMARGERPEVDLFFDRTERQHVVIAEQFHAAVLIHDRGVIKFNHDDTAAYS